MLNKLANIIELSFKIPEAEKGIAKEVSDLLLSFLNLLELAKDHLGIIYAPFQKYTNISQEALEKKRGVLNRYKQQIKENFNKVKYQAFKAIDKLNYFSSDTHILELLTSFKDGMDDIEKEVEFLLNLLDNYKSPDFRQGVISGIEEIKKQSQQVENLVNDRIIDYLDANILTKNWISDTEDELQSKIKDKIPLITELFNQRQQALEEDKSTTAINIQKRPQLMNPGNAQKVWNPSDLRQTSENGEE